MLTMQRSQPKRQSGEQKVMHWGQQQEHYDTGPGPGRWVPPKSLDHKVAPRHGHLQEEKLEARSCNLTLSGKVGTWQIQVSMAPRELVWGQ